MTTAAEYWGLPPAPASSSQPGQVGDGSQPETNTHVTAGKGIWHQDPVLLLVVLVGVAFLLARGAEHGISFGFNVSSKAKV